MPIRPKFSTSCERVPQPRARAALSAALVLLLASSCGVVDRAAEPPVPVKGASRVERLFDTFRHSSGVRLEFPELGWADVDALLALADDEQRLTRFPNNALSSQSQSHCSVGVLALWFIEGIRRAPPGGYPSLNPLCLGPRRDARGWLEDSEQNRAAAAAAYRAWWDEVGALSPEEREARDPLAGTGLSWH